MTDVDIMIVVNDAGTLGKLTNAWVYWKEGGAFNVLRADDQGLIFKRKGSDANQPASYTTRFTSIVGQQVEVYFSEGAKPLPQALVEPLLRQREVPLSLSSDLASLGPIHVTPGKSATIRRLPLARIDLEPPRISLTSPGDEPALLLTTFEPLLSPTDPYYVDGIPQGQAFFAATNTAARENGVAPPAAITARARPRGIRVTGALPADAKGAKLKLLNAEGKALPLLSDGANLASAPVEELKLTLEQPSGKQRPFSADIFLPMDTAFGHVQIVIETEGLSPPHVAGFSFLLAGAQVAVVDDFPAGATGDKAGAVPTASDEVVVLDYTSSPAQVQGTGSTADKDAARAQQRAAGRARRLLRFPIQSVLRPAGGSPQQLVSQMPFLMVELQLLGADRAAWEELLRLREQRAVAPTSELRLSTDWALNINWPTPDRGQSQAVVQPPFDLTAKQDIVLKLDAAEDVTARKLDGVDKGRVTNAFTPAPPTLAFPEAGRRQPGVLVSEPSAELKRAWGRHGGSAQPGTVIEWQPIFTTDGAAASKPVMRGGNVEIKLTSLTLAGAPVAGDLQFSRPTPQGQKPSAAPPTAPLAFVPHFRIHGLNPSRDDLNLLVDAITEREFNANRASKPYLDFLPLAVWQLALRGITIHETDGRQFATPGRQATGVIAFGGTTTFAHGKERDMPIFGHPHGFGVGQLDPPSNIEQLWNLEEAVLGCVQRLLLEKAADARSGLGHEFLGTAPLSTRSKNVFLRESVRRFNGGREFVRNAADDDWEVSPSIKADPTIFYCDEVLNGGETLRYQDLIRAPNKREPAAASRGPLATRLPYTSASFVDGL